MHQDSRTLVTHDSFHLSTLTQLSFCQRHPQEKLFLLSRAAASIPAQPCQVKITSRRVLSQTNLTAYWERNLEPILSFYSAEKQKRCFSHKFLKRRYVLIRLSIWIMQEMLKEKIERDVKPSSTHKQNVRKDKLTIFSVFLQLPVPNLLLPTLTSSKCLSTFFVTQ